MAVQEMQRLPASPQVDHHAVQLMVVRLAVLLFDRNLVVLEGECRGLRVLGRHLSPGKTGKARMPVARTMQGIALAHDTAVPRLLSVLHAEPPGARSEGLVRSPEGRVRRWELAAKSAAVDKGSLTNPG